MYNLYETCFKYFSPVQMIELLVCVEYLHNSISFIDYFSQFTLTIGLISVTATDIKNLKEDIL